MFQQLLTPVGGNLFLSFLAAAVPLAVVLVSAGFSIASFYVIGTLLKVPLPVGPWGF